MYMSVHIVIVGTGNRGSRIGPRITNQAIGSIVMSLHLRLKGVTTMAQTIAFPGANMTRPSAARLAVMLLSAVYGLGVHSMSKVPFSGTGEALNLVL
jgi:hypothetical protein